MTVAGSQGPAQPLCSPPSSHDQWRRLQWGRIITEEWISLLKDGKLFDRLNCLHLSNMDNISGTHSLGWKLVLSYCPLATWAQRILVLKFKTCHRTFRSTINENVLNLFKYNCILTYWPKLGQQAWTMTGMTWMNTMGWNISAVRIKCVKTRYSLCSWNIYCVVSNKCST